MQNSGGASQNSTAMNLMESGSDGDSSGGYEKYMNKYAGGSSGSSGGYDKYMNQYAGGSSGGYQKYMKEYADKYMDQYTGGKGGSAGYEKYYQKYMQTSGGASQDNSAINLQSQDSNGGYEKYMKQYAGGSNGGYEKYMKQYAGGSQGSSGNFDYQKYMNVQYKNLGQFVPSAYQHYADSTVDQQYKQRLIEL